MIEIRHVASDAAAPDGALTRAPGPFLLHTVGAAPSDAARATVDAALGEVLAAAAPADTGLSAPTFREGRPDDRRLPAGGPGPPDRDRRGPRPGRHAAVRPRRPVTLPPPLA